MNRLIKNIKYKTRFDRRSTWIDQWQKHWSPRLHIWINGTIRKKESWICVKDDISIFKQKYFEGTIYILKRFTNNRLPPKIEDRVIPSFFRILHAISPRKSLGITFFYWMKIIGPLISFNTKTITQKLNYQVFYNGKRSKIIRIELTIFFYEIGSS